MPKAARLTGPNGHVLFNAVLLLGLLQSAIRPLRAQLASADDIAETLSTLWSFANPFLLITVYCACRLSLSAPRTNIDPTLKRLVGLSLLLYLIPSSQVTLLTMALCAGLYCIYGRQSRESRLAYLLWILLALRAPLSEACLNLLAGPLLNFDAYLSQYTYQALSFWIDAATVAQGHQRIELIILSGCSSFTQLSWVLLAYLALSFKRQPASNRRARTASIDLQCCAWLFVIALWVILQNSVRLALMQGSLDQYAYFHSGLGAQYFDLGLSLSPWLFAFLNNE